MNARLVCWLTPSCLAATTLLAAMLASGVSYAADYPEKFL
jgi:hypothetical protein